MNKNMNFIHNGIRKFTQSAKVLTQHDKRLHSNQKPSQTNPNSVSSQNEHHCHCDILLLCGVCICGVFFSCALATEQNSILILPESQSKK